MRDEPLRYVLIEFGKLVLLVTALVVFVLVLFNF